LYIQDLRYSILDPQAVVLGSEIMTNLLICSHNLIMIGLCKTGIYIHLHKYIFMCIYKYTNIYTHADMYVYKDMQMCRYKYVNMHEFIDM
jgi:hypothetical protein